ncbi:ribonuclease HII [Salipaludibacillus daqingensis]|uniref:ribonuclease HII n=1 Tax=Salipaludibacillus daqingensis TaxID=3041001 RepID=UPI002473C7D5|nr:ribonuclease HII [Salipaludibacillus daqingensis]
MKKKTMKEIKQLLTNISSDEDPMMKDLLVDERKGVQQLIKSWHNQQKKQDQLEHQFIRMMHYERENRQRGFMKIAGLDEVGRGPLAGPVVAACVILPEDFKLLGLTDSKKLSAKNRDLFYDKIIDGAVAVGIGEASAKEIDEINILQASKKAMIRAIEQLSDVTPDFLLVDAMELPMNIPQQSLIKGDAKSISIAASSVIAKVTRDRYMERLHNEYPMYHFDKHMGYGTEIHLRAMKEYGVLDEHRRSFAPVRAHL